MFTLLTRTTAAAILASALATPAIAQDWKSDLPAFRVGLLGGENEADRLRKNECMVEQLGEKLGVPMEVTAAQFSGLIPALQAGTYDFLVAPTTVTEERAQNLLFTEGFMDTNFRFTVPKGSEAEGFDSLEDFKGLTIAVNKGSVYESFLTERAAEMGWTVVAFGTNTDAIQAMTSGRADANMAGATVSAWAVQKNPQIALSYEYATGLVWGLPFRKDDVATRDLIDSVLECLKTDGTMAAPSEKVSARPRC